MPHHRAAFGALVFLGLAFGLLACPAPPSGPAGTPVALPPRSTPGLPAEPVPTVVLGPTPTLRSGPLPAATATPGAVATASVAGRPWPLRAQDFDLVEVGPSRPQEERSLREVRVADLDGDGTSEVFAEIAVGPLADVLTEVESTYRLHYGLFSFDAPRSRWASLRQEVVFWRPPADYEPCQMWAEFADLIGAGRQQVLLYSGYGRDGERAQLEVLAVSGHKIAPLLSLSGQRFYIVRNGRAFTLLQPLSPPPLRTGDGPAVLVVGEPVYEPSEVGPLAVAARLTYYAWDGRQFSQIRQEERGGYPVLPASLP